MALWNKLDLQDVREHLWIVVERDAPRLVARRRASPELLEEGRNRLAELMAVYAPVSSTGTGRGSSPKATPRWRRGRWSTIQPWMTNGAGPHGGYFAPSAVPTEGTKAAAYEEAA